MMRTGRWRGRVDGEDTKMTRRKMVGAGNMIGTERCYIMSLDFVKAVVRRGFVLELT